MFHYYCCLCEWLTVDYIKLDGKSRVGKIGSRVPSKISSGGQGSHLIGLSGVFWTKVPSAVCGFTNWVHSRRIPWRCIIKCNALLNIKLASSIANCPVFFQYWGNPNERYAYTCIIFTDLRCTCINSIFTKLKK